MNTKLLSSCFCSVRLHVMQRTVLLSQFSVCPSVRLSVCLLDAFCDKTK